MKWSVTGITLFTRQIHIQWVIVGKTSHAVDQIMRSTVDSIIQHEIRRWEHKIQITRHRASRRKRPQKTWRVGHLAPVLSVNSSVTLPDQKFSSKRSATTYSESRPTNCECTKDVWASRNDSLVSRTNWREPINGRTEGKQTLQTRRSWINAFIYTTWENTQEIF